MSECKTIKCVLDRLNKKIEKDNKVFATLSNQEKRIRIAWDVLAQIEAGTLNIRTGRFITPVGSPTSLPELQKECSACALGGLFLSSIKHKSEFVSSDDLWSFKNSNIEALRIINSELTNFFDVNQLHEIELMPYLDSKDTEIKTPGFPYPKKVAKTAKK